METESRLRSVQDRATAEPHEPLIPSAAADYTQKAARDFLVGTFIVKYLLRETRWLHRTATREQTKIMGISSIETKAKPRKWLVIRMSNLWFLSFKKRKHLNKWSEMPLSASWERSISVHDFIL